MVGHRQDQSSLWRRLGSFVAISLLLGACGADQVATSSHTPVVGEDSGDAASSGAQDVGAGVVLLRQGFTVIVPQDEVFPLPHVSAAVELEAPAGSGLVPYQVTFSFRDYEDHLLGSEDTFTVIEAGRTGYAKVNFAELTREPASFSVRVQEGDRNSTLITQVIPLEVISIAKTGGGDASLVKVSMEGTGDPDVTKEVQCVAFVSGELAGGYTEIGGGPGSVWSVDLPFGADEAHCWAQLYETAAPATSPTTTTTTTTTTVPSTTTTAPQGITLAQYEQLHLGMPEAEVWSIVTAPCRLDGETQIPPIEVNGEVAYEGLTGKQYMCETGSGFAVIGIQNGSVSFLSQYGLR